MGSILDPTLANALFCLHERKWLGKCPLEFEAVFYKKYVDDIFDLFKSTNHLVTTLIFVTPICPFYLRKKKR